MVEGEREPAALPGDRASEHDVPVLLEPAGVPTTRRPIGRRVANERCNAHPGGLRDRRRVFAGRALRKESHPGEGIAAQTAEIELVEGEAEGVRRQARSLRT